MPHVITAYFALQYRPSPCGFYSLAICILQAEADLTHPIHLKHLNANNVVNIYYIFYLRNSVGSQLGDMDHTVLVRRQLYKCAVRHNAYNLSFIGLAHFDRIHDGVDDPECLIDTLLLYAADIDTSGIINVDLNAGSVDDTVDGLAALTDDGSDLICLNNNTLMLLSVFKMIS